MILLSPMTQIAQVLPVEKFANQFVILLLNSLIWALVLAALWLIVRRRRTGGGRRFPLKSEHDSDTDHAR